MRPTRVDLLHNQARLEVTSCPSGCCEPPALQIVFAVLHGLMPLGRRTSLAYLSAGDRATLYIFNVMTAYVLLDFAYLLLGHARTLTTVGAGRAAIVGMRGFWVLRGLAGLALNGLLARAVIGSADAVFERTNLGGIKQQVERYGRAVTSPTPVAALSPAA